VARKSNSWVLIPDWTYSSPDAALVLYFLCKELQLIMCPLLVSFPGVLLYK